MGGVKRVKSTVSPIINFSAVAARVSDKCQRWGINGIVLSFAARMWGFVVSGNWE